MDKIIMKNMKFYGFHGVLPEEQENGQYFYIDVELGTDLGKAGKFDELEYTVDYSAVYDIIKHITENKKFRLIEGLADSISQEILLQYDKIIKIIVRIRKPGAPICGEFDWMGVEIQRSRDE